MTATSSPVLSDQLTQRGLASEQVKSRYLAL
jgi:hypothetical protein